jgi:hypothetical protein
VAELPTPTLASTTEASAAVAQSRGEGETPGAAGVGSAAPPDTAGFEIAARVSRGAGDRPYERRPGDPVYRPLRIYALDPGASQREGAVAVVNVPYEPLPPGPVGAILEVDGRDGVSGTLYRAAELDAPDVLIRSGYDPSPSDPRFHQQMVYAVCMLVYATFRRALGRHVSWGFQPSGGDGGGRLRVRPYASSAPNACYDRVAGELAFGYYPAPGEVAGRNVPSGLVFTSLSHDIVTHEVTHALLDGLRSRFCTPTGEEVLAFHEGFADLVALFQRFSYPEVVRAAIRESRGALDQAGLLTGLARQFGHTTTARGPLRTAIRIGSDGGLIPRVRDRSAPEPHALGSVLVSAVFDAFVTVFRRKTERYVRLATGGTGILPPGEIPADLQAVLAGEASQLASQFLSLCIRAIDYCPPVDLELGEFLRAVVTADHDLVPDDPWGYREAWIDAFSRHRIYPKGVKSLAEDALLWQAPARDIPEEPALSFAQLQFQGDPGQPAGADELRRQAAELGRIVVRHLDQFGMVRADDPGLGGDRVSLPRVESIRSCRRVGPDGQVVFDLVAEVIQKRTVRDAGAEFDVFGGATVILDPRGRVRYVIAKNILNGDRLARQREYLRTGGSRFWTPPRDGRRIPTQQLFRLLHAEPGDGTGPTDASSTSA